MGDEARKQVAKGRKGRRTGANVPAKAKGKAVEPKPITPQLPSYDPATAQSVCEAIESGQSLRQACAAVKLPHPTFLKWVSLNLDGLRDHYAHACAVRAEGWADEIVSIADGSTDSDVQRDRLRVDTRKWIIAKMLPKVYGDRQTVEHTGNILHVLSTLPPSEAERLAALPAADFEAEIARLAE